MKLLWSCLMVACAQVPTAAKTDGETEVLLSRGRELLAAGDPQAAETLFLRASELEHDSFRTRQWVLRAWMDQGRSNDTLDALDALTKAGRKGPEMDYLYGMAFVRRAEGYVASGVTDSSIDMNFQDAVSYLGRAVEERPRDFPDAYQALATAAWYTLDLPRARAAADNAVRATPRDGGAWLVLGRVAMSQFVEQMGSSTWNADTEGLWLVAKDAFAESVRAYGTPELPARRSALADAAQELGQAWIWKLDRAEAAKAFALALSWAPERVDLQQIHGFFQAPADATEGDPSAALFRQLVEDGLTGFEQHAPPDDPRLGPLSWWVGWACYRAGDFAAAEQAFLAALERNPEFVNSWFFVAMGRDARQDWTGATAAFRRGWEAAPDALLAEMRRAPEANAARVAALIGRILPAQAVGEDGELLPPEESWLDCALLAEICAETVPTEPSHWNNLGLFLRDEGDRLRALEDEGTPPDPKVLSDLDERAYRAYGRALALAPEDPQLLNDTAVMLHYYLERDLEKALEMYGRAAELARAHLAGPALVAEDRARFEQALDDATTNKKELEDLLEARAAGRAEKKP